MNWVPGTGRGATTSAASAGQALAERTEGAAPGMATLLQGLGEDRSHSVLDLGRAADLNLRMYSRYARWVRFADLLGEAWTRASGSAAGILSDVPGQPEHPYDVVFAWDTLERLFPEQRPQLVQGLVELTAPGARLHLITRGDDPAARPLHFTLLDVNRFGYEPAGSVPLPRPRLVPAEVNRLLQPFLVQHAYTLRNGLREYVAARPKG